MRHEYRSIDDNCHKCVVMAITAHEVRAITPKKCVMMEKTHNKCVAVAITSDKCVR